MKKTLSTSEIANALFKDEYGGWSAAGSWAIAEYLEEYEEDTGEELELDVVAIRCEYSEYKNLQDWAVGYFGGAHEAEEGILGETYEGEDFDALVREYIRDNGQLIEFDGGIIVSAF